MESKGTQKDDPDTNASGNSPLMMGYEVSDVERICFANERFESIFY